MSAPEPASALHAVGLLGQAGAAYAALGRLEEAKQAVTSGLKLSPDGTWLHLALPNIALPKATLPLAAGQTRY